MDKITRSAPVFSGALWHTSEIPDMPESPVVLIPGPPKPIPLCPSSKRTRYYVVALVAAALIAVAVTNFGLAVLKALGL